MNFNNLLIFFPILTINLAIIFVFLKRDYRQKIYSLLVIYSSVIVLLFLLSLDHEMKFQIFEIITVLIALYAANVVVIMVILRRLNDSNR